MHNNPYYAIRGSEMSQQSHSVVNRSKHKIVIILAINIDIIFLLLIKQIMVYLENKHRSICRHHTQTHFETNHNIM